MAKAEEKKMLGILPRSTANVLLVGLAVTVIIALIWSWVEAQNMLPVEKGGGVDAAWLMIIEMLALAVIVGVVVGALAGNAKPITLWVAAGLAIVGTVLVQALIKAAMLAPLPVESEVEGALGKELPIDAAILDALPTEVFTLDVSIGYVILAVVAAACVVLGNKIKL